MFYVPSGPDIPIEKASIRLIRRFEKSMKTRQQVQHSTSASKDHRKPFKTLTQETVSLKRESMKLRLNKERHKLPLIQEKKLFLLKGKVTGQQSQRKICEKKTSLAQRTVRAARGQKNLRKKVSIDEPSSFYKLQPWDTYVNNSLYKYN